MINESITNWWTIRKMALLVIMLLSPSPPPPLCTIFIIKQIRSRITYYSCWLDLKRYCMGLAIISLVCERTEINNIHETIYPPFINQRPHVAHSRLKLPQWLCSTTLVTSMGGSNPGSLELGCNNLPEFPSSLHHVITRAMTSWHRLGYET